MFALPGIAEASVGRAHFFKGFLGAWSPVLVRVHSQSQLFVMDRETIVSQMICFLLTASVWDSYLAIGFLQLVFCGCLCDAKDVIKVTLAVDLSREFFLPASNHKE